MKHEIINLQDVQVIGMAKDVPEGMKLFPIYTGQWLKVHFEGGMKCFQQQFQKVHQEWLPQHPEYKWADNAQCMGLSNWSY